VSDWFGRHLLGFDTADHREVLRVPLGQAPAGVAVSTDGATVFVAERDDNQIAAIDVDTASVRWRIKVGEHPFALLLDGPRQRLYALNVYSHDVSVIDVRDPAAPRLEGRVQVGKAPYGAALAAGGTRLYITNQHDDTVSVIDPETLTVMQTLTGFGYPEGVASAGDRVWVVNWMDDNLVELNASTGQRLRVVDTGRNPRGFGAFIGDPAAP
jgi:YVTN family beta-propeller protein